MGRVSDARDFAAEAHKDQRYGDKPYVAHLDQVFVVLRRFFHQDEDLFCAAYLHDTLEDTEATEADVRDRFGDRVAAIVAAVTLEKGVPRHSALGAAYARIRATPGADQVKLADRIANVEACLEDGVPDKLARYRSEHPDFREAVSPAPGKRSPMLEYLDALIQLERPPYAARRTFTCAECGGPAATFTCYASDAPAFPGGWWSGKPPAILFEGFLFTTICPIKDSHEEAAAALTAGDLDRLGKHVGDLLAAFLCRRCSKPHCSKHWGPQAVFDDGMFDCARGTCPRGHEQTLSD